MFIIPVEGCLVPDPARGGVLPADGRNVEPSTYWLRRLEAGEVTERTEAEIKAPLAARVEAPATEPEIIATDKKSVKK